MPPGQAWTEPQPHLITAAVALSAGWPDSCAAALDAADGILESLPAGQQVACRLSTALIRLAVCLRTGDLMAAAAATARAELLVSQVPARKLARHPDIRSRLLSGRGAVELWSGHLDQAARVLEAVVEAASGSQDERAACVGHLALAEAWRGRLRRAAELAGRAATVGEHRLPVQNPNPAALVALAWVHLEHYELHETGLGLPGRGRRYPGRGTRRSGRADHHQGAVRMARSGLARPAAEPSRVTGVHGGRRHPGGTGRRRAGRRR